MLSDFKKMFVFTIANRVERLFRRNQSKFWRQVDEICSRFKVEKKFGAKMTASRLDCHCFFLKR